MLMSFTKTDVLKTWPIEKMWIDVRNFPAVEKVMFLRGPQFPFLLLILGKVYVNEDLCNSIDLQIQKWRQTKPCSPLAWPELLIKGLVVNKRISYVKHGTRTNLVSWALWKSMKSAVENYWHRNSLLKDWTVSFAPSSKWWY